MHAKDVVHIENWAADAAESGPDATQIGKWTAGRPVRADPSDLVR
jgi:hypothetical protein